MKAWIDQGNDKQELLDKADSNGKLNHQTVKYNSDLRRDMRRHPDNYSQAELREAGVWNMTAIGEFEGEGTVGEIWQDEVERMQERSSKRRETKVSEEEEDDEEQEEEDEDEDEEDEED